MLYRSAIHSCCALLLLFALPLLVTQAPPATYDNAHAQTAMPTTPQTDNTRSWREHQVRSQGVDISYRVFGSGAPILIINGGFGLDSVGFEGLAQRLGRNHQAILFDRRGVGKSVMSEINHHTMTMDLVIEDIEAIRQDLQHASWGVLGHSFGGMVAAYYTAKHPSRISKLILSSSAGIDLTLFNGDPKESIHAQLSSADRSRLLALEKAYRAHGPTQKLLHEFSETLARAYVFNDQHSPQIARRLRRTNDRVGQLLSDDLKRIAFNTKSALRRFMQPVLIIQGQHDVMVTEIAHLTHETLPHSQLVILENSGHYGWLDQPEKYISAVLTFLAGRTR